MRTVALLVILLAACGDEAVEPAPYSAGGAGAAPNAESVGVGAGGAPSVKRTVEQRNPFGNVAATANLMWDGDFEWRATFASQYSWLASATPQFIQYDSPPLEMGPRCRSGLKCARLDAGWVMLGLGVASQLGGLSVSVWIKPEEASCVTTASVIYLSQSNKEPSLTLDAESNTPGDDGWCHCLLTTPVRKTASYLYIQNTGRSPLLVDDAVIEQAGGAESALVHPSGGVVPESVAEPLRARAWEATRPRIKPPSAEQLRFEQRMRSRRWTR